jgi:hypothetical protein
LQLRRRSRLVLSRIAHAVRKAVPQRHIFTPRAGAVRDSWRVAADGRLRRAMVPRAMIVATSEIAVLRPLPRPAYRNRTHRHEHDRHHDWSEHPGRGADQLSHLSVMLAVRA